MKFEEKYWDDALAVLKQQERLAWRKKWLPRLAILLLLITLGGVFTVLQQTEEGQSLATETEAAEVHLPQVQHGEETVTETQKSSTTPTLSNAPIPPKTTPEKRVVTVDPSASENPLPADDNTKEDVLETVNPANPKVDLRASEKSTGQQMLNEISGLDASNSISRPSSMKYLIPLSPKHNFQPTLKYGNYDYKKVFPLKADHKFIHFGQSFMTGYGTRSSENFFNPELGIGFEKVYTPKWSWNVQLNYFNVSGIAHVAEFAQTSLDFGYHTTLTRIKTNKLHFVYLPIQGNWDFSRRNSLTAGVGVSYLVNGLSLVTVSELDNFSETELDRFEEWGYVGGYKSVNFSVLLGYEFRITPDWVFGLQYQYGLNEITKEDIYGAVRRDRNSRLRITLKYAIWK